MSKLFNTSTFQYSSDIIHTVPHTKDQDRIGKDPDRQTDRQHIRGRQTYIF